MKFTSLLLALSTLAATASTSAPMPSNTTLRINTAPRLAIAKSSVSSTLARAPLDSATEEHAALHHLSKAFRDTSNDAVKARGSIHGTSRRSLRASKSSRAQHRATDRPARTYDRKSGRRSRLRTARSQPTRSARQQQQHQRRERKFLTARS